MINFCTLFDSNYLTRGLALYESLEKNCPSFHLYVVTFDDDCYSYLFGAGLSCLTPISLKEFEDEELLAVKASRSAAEYCWTCTPSVILYCLKKFNLPSCTYLDADMIFYNDPSILLKEAGNNSVLITEHRHSKEYVQPQAGIYCVQFVYFRNNSVGLTALTWWRERCIEWCYAYLEDNKFGDQKYLDDWPQRFSGVHVLQHMGGGIAPWNAQQYNIVDETNYILEEKKTGQKFPLVFFHYHGLKFYTDNMVSCSNSIYELDASFKETLYFPYIKRLLQLKKNIREKGIKFGINGANSASPGKWTVFRQFARERLVLLKIGNISIFQLNFFTFRKHYHFYPLEAFQEKLYGIQDRS